MKIKALQGTMNKLQTVFIIHIVEYFQTQYIKNPNHHWVFIKPQFPLLLGTAMDGYHLPFSKTTPAALAHIFYFYFLFLQNVPNRLFRRGLFMQVSWTRQPGENTHLLTLSLSHLPDSLLLVMSLFCLHSHSKKKNATKCLSRLLVRKVGKREA